MEKFVQLRKEYTKILIIIKKNICMNKYHISPDFISL